MYKRVISLSQTHLAMAAIIGFASAANAQTEHFETTIKVSVENASAQLACDIALDQAQAEAYLQLEEATPSSEPLGELELTVLSQNRRKSDNATSICEVTSTWQHLASNEISTLIGTEQSISGLYTGQCLDEARQAVCWNRITDQAKQDLAAKLLQNYRNDAEIRLIYAGFEGRQRDQFKDKRYTTTADGTFYFDVVDIHDVSSINIQRENELTSPPPENPAPKPVSATKSSQPSIDISLSYTWDGNDGASVNSTAISSDRLGFGVWANERIGFVAFTGKDTVGVGQASSSVDNLSSSYSTTGIGMGVRLWNHHDFAVENLIYYVDARPYETDITDACGTCTDRTFNSEDYVQATVNLKTNSKGFNIGWMLTWKWLNETANVDNLSAGWYIEVLF